MCKFFSLISDGNGNPYYFNWEQRQAILRRDPKFSMVETADSHSSISSYYGFVGEKADKVNKYEYNPLTQVFEVDQINTTDDKAIIEKFCREVDFKTIVKPLIIKKMFNPLKDVKAKRVTKKDLDLLKEWASVGASVWDSVRDSVMDSVGDSVRDSVRDSVGASVWDSVRDSVMASVWASVSTYFDIKYKHNFGASHKLLERGFVPSFDGKKWRLHSGPKAKIVWEGTVKDLEQQLK